jgi:hypothetical protein
MNSRIQFEKVFRFHDLSTYTDGFGKTQYRNEIVRILWEGWEEAWELRDQAERKNHDLKTQPAQSDGSGG